MGAFNVGDLVYVKTTGEAGIVRGIAPVLIDTGNDTMEVRGYIVDLALPSITKDGPITHGEHTRLHDSLLETFEEKTRRELANVIKEQQLRVEAREEFEAWMKGRKAFELDLEGMEGTVVQ